MTKEKPTANALAGSNKIGPEGPNAGYENPATLYLVPDLNRLPKNVWKPFIAFPIGCQPLPRQYITVLQQHLAPDQLKQQLPQQLAVVILE